MRLLVVEDEEDLVEALRVGFVRAGYAVWIARDPAQAGERLQADPYDVVLLDLDLPGRDGFELCRALRRTAHGESTRIIMATARDRLDDRVLGLAEGPDDYLVKPFAFPQLLARVSALPRPEPAGDAPILQVGDLRLDVSRAEARVRGRELGLTPKEFGVLRHLMIHHGQVVSAEELLERVWGEHADPLTNTVRVTVGNLRRKLGGEGVIETVISRGYRLREGP